MDDDIDQIIGIANATLRADLEDLSGITWADVAAEIDEAMREKDVETER